MQLEIMLLEWQRHAQYIGITSNILVLIAATLSEKIETEKQNGSTYTPPIAPSKITAMAVLLTFIYRVWLARIAMIRLNILQESKRRGKYPYPINPNYKMVMGNLILLAGTLMIAIGLQQKAASNNQIVIL